MKLSYSDAINTAQRGIGGYRQICNSLNLPFLSELLSLVLPWCPAPCIAEYLAHNRYCVFLLGSVPDEV